MKNYSFPFWLHHRLHGVGERLRLLDDLLDSQWWPAEAISSYQLMKTREILQYAQTNTEYYNDLFRSIGLKDVRDITGLADLEKIPVLTKATIRAQLPLLTARRDDLIEYQTGGSTGVPLKFYCNKRFLNIEKPAVGFRAYMHGGCRPSDGMGMVWGFDSGIPKRSIGQQFVTDHVIRELYLNSFELSDESMQNFLDEMRRRKFRFLKGYANSLAELARYIVRKGISPALSLDAIFSEAERLDEEKRALIEKAFGAKVINYYGSREFGTIAVECTSHQGLHVNFEQLLVEIDRDGRVLVTSFLNKGTVFIRYEIGDNAGALLTGTCACGRSSPRLDRILGRQSDNFVAPDGRVVHGEYITHLFYHSQAVEQFQMVQNTTTSFTLDVVTKNEALATREMEGMLQKLNEKFGAELSVSIRFVDQIEKTRLGKQRFTICNIARGAS